MFKHWRLLISVLVFGLILIAASNLLDRPLPAKKNSSTLSATSSAVIINEAGSSADIASSSEQTTSIISDKDEHTIQKIVVKEIYRPDGTLESRETTNSDYRRNKQRQQVSQASSSSEIAHISSREASVSIISSVVASSSETVVFEEKAGSGIGPIVWATAEGTYAGLSYRVLAVDIIDLNASAVLGTRLTVLPDLDISTGLFISKPIAPGLELGLVGTVRVPDLDRQLGLGLSYQF